MKGMGINLCAVMLLMGAVVTEDVNRCGKIRILGFFLQDLTGSFGGILGPGMPFETEVSKFMDGILAVCPGSLFGIYGFTDRTYGHDLDTPTVSQKSDFVYITSLVDIPTADSQLSKLEYAVGGGGYNTGAYDVMYHIIKNGSDSGLDSIVPLPDTYDAKVLYVLTDGIPEYLESTPEECFNGTVAGSCWGWCVANESRCCDYDEKSKTNTPKTSLVDYGASWNPLAHCPIDLATLGKVINDDDWYVAYIGASFYGGTEYNWSMQVDRMGIGSRFTHYPVFYNYSGLADQLANVTTQILCSPEPTNEPSNLPTGGPTNASTTGGATTGGPTTGGPTLSTQSSEGGTTTTTTKTTKTTTTKTPFPIGLVSGCAAGALAAIAGAAVAANRLSGSPTMPEFEFEGEEGMGREESQRETQVAMGEADFA